jgi:excisionase family DNA binding protein
MSAYVLDPLKQQRENETLANGNDDDGFGTPKQIFAWLNVGHTKGYELIKQGRLHAYKMGRSTKITWASARHLAAALPPAVMGKNPATKRGGA